MTEADDKRTTPPIDPEVIDALEVTGEHADELEAVAKAIDPETLGTLDALTDFAEATQGLDHHDLTALIDLAAALETVTTAQNRAEQLAAAREGIDAFRDSYEAAESADERLETVRATSKLLRELNRETYDALEYE